MKTSKVKSIECIAWDMIGKKEPFTPYIEGGAGFNTPDNGDTEDFTVLEVGTKVKLTDDLSIISRVRTTSSKMNRSGRLKSEPSIAF